mgnify:CR=1 FL=1
MEIGVEKRKYFCFNYISIAGLFLINLMRYNMIYLPIQYLRPGMTLAKSIASSAGLLSLIVAGQKLTPSAIVRLRRAGIPGAYIQSSFGDDLVPEDFFEPEYKTRVITELKSVYTDFSRTHTFSNRHLDISADLAEDMVVKILNKDEYLVNVVAIKDYDNYTYSHSMCVAVLSVLIGIRMGYSERELKELALSGLLHDIGKVDIPIEIINKHGALTESEFAEIKKHPLKSVEHIRSCCALSQMVLAGVAEHHEKYDGTGYPYGLQGENICIYARILALADVYDALTSERAYRQAWSPSEAIEYMLTQGNTHFDYELLQTFLKTVVAYPVGSIIRLSDDSLGLVVRTSPDNTLRPVVRIIRSAGKAGKGDIIDLSSDFSYLNVTVTGDFGRHEEDELPEDLVDLKEDKKLLKKVL